MKRLGLITLFLTLSIGVAAADESGKVSLELNKLEPRDGACRAYLVIGNNTDIAFESLKLDLVMFDTDDIVAERLAVETAPLPAGKTSLKVFDIQGLACANMGRLLLNDVMQCSDSNGKKRRDCLPRITTSARGERAFSK